MNETRQVPGNGIDFKSLDELLSIDVDSYLTDAPEADFIFHDDAPRSRLTRVFSNKLIRRASFVATGAAVLLALSFAPFFTRQGDKPSNDVQFAAKLENGALSFSMSNGSTEASTSVDLDETFDNLAFWNYGSELCDSLTNRAIDSTRNLYRDAMLEFSECRHCLAQIAGKYSEASTLRNERPCAQDDPGDGMINASRRPDSKRGLNFDPTRIPETLTPSKVDYSRTMGAIDDKNASPENGSSNNDMQIASNDSLEEIPEKKVDKENCAEYTLKGSVVLLSSRAPLSASAPVVRSEEPGVCTGVELLYVDPFFRAVREIYLCYEKEKERGAF